MARVPLAGTEWIPGPSERTADVVIVGGGIEGAAAAWALSQRGVTDVVVAERNTVGSGMTGKSSGIVRCHYGVSSLAAMATVGLEVFEKAEEIFGIRHRVPPDRLRRRGGRRQMPTRCAKALPHNEPSECRPRRSTPPRWPGCGRSPT